MRDGAELIAAIHDHWPTQAHVDAKHEPHVGQNTKEHGHEHEHHERRLLDQDPEQRRLAEDRRVLKALESWHPGYIDWWKDMGPDGFQESLVYLRTAYSVDPHGWAKFDYVRMPDYRWGILLAPQEENRVVPFGEH